MLAEEGVLEQFFPQESEIVGKLRQSFAGMYDLDRKGKYQAQHQAAMEDPAKYVMKPQREGGGTLVVGNAIVEALQKWDDDKLNSHILMERINPVAAPNFLAFGEKLSPVVNVVPEIGIFHSFMATPSGEVLHDDTCGYLVRSKPSDVEDGGVAAGRAALDSLYLYDLPQ